MTLWPLSRVWPVHVGGDSSFKGPVASLVISSQGLPSLVSIISFGLRQITTNLAASGRNLFTNDGGTWKEAETPISTPY